MVLNPHDEGASQWRLDIMHICVFCLLQLHRVACFLLSSTLVLLQYRFWGQTAYDLRGLPPKNGTAVILKRVKAGEVLGGEQNAPRVKGLTNKSRCSLSPSMHRHPLLRPSRPWDCSFLV